MTNGNARPELARRCSGTPPFSKAGSPTSRRATPARAWRGISGEPLNSPFHILPSCPANAGHPVRRGFSKYSRTPVLTGSPAFAGDDDWRCKYPFIAQLICPTGRFPNSLSSPFCKNISLFPKSKSVVVSAPSRPHKRGGSRSSRTLRRDAVDALVSRDERRQRGRRSRVVLAPRRWR